MTPAIHRALSNAPSPPRDAENPERLVCDICRLLIEDDPLFVRGRDGEVRCWMCRENEK